MKLSDRIATINIRKTAHYAVWVNLLQILAVWALTLIMFIEHRTAATLLSVLISAIVTVGAVLDIREAFAAQRKADEADTLGDMVRQMDSLNRALRAQRHDFLNHLQVVFSLIEMEEYAEAGDYIEKVHGDMQSVSRTMRTGNPAINALLRAKLSDLEAAGILTELDVSGSWQALPLPAWEFCRVLSNLLDNACDALSGVRDAHVAIHLREDVRGYSFSVMNNGPAIPPAIQQRIFEPGISTRGEGRGMGLYIVRKTLSAHGGEVHLTSDEQATIFSGFIRKELHGKADTGT